jgi:ABC-type bacteriocin/lantibiotic exporter with double-glycine peptidase domain
MPGSLLSQEQKPGLSPSRTAEAGDETSDEIELVAFSPTPSSTKATDVISVRNGAFGWDKDAEPILRDINLTIERSSLTLLIGPVASGKSTLLKALLGETPSSKGFVYVSTLESAWCEQTPWLIVCGSLFPKDFVS